MCLLAGCGGKAAEAAKAATEGFRARWLSRSYTEIYRQAAPEFRASGSEEQFTKLINAIHRKLGQWRSAEEPTWVVSTGTAGTMVMLGYKSQFEKGPATEQFVWRIKGGEARLVSYHVNSPISLSD